MDLWRLPSTINVTPGVRVARLVRGAGRVGALAAFGLSVAACGGSADDQSSGSEPAASAQLSGAAAGAAGVRQVSAADAAALLDAGDRVVIDIRTAEEFAEGHLAGAQMIDFYGTDFAERIGQLDKDAKYVMYCRSGNRSGQALPLFEQLGFADVAEIDGGIGAWVSAGLPMES